jgi:hypothetical protein
LAGTSNTADQLMSTYQEAIKLLNESKILMFVIALLRLIVV